ncbi:MAG: zinc-binding dehydrogenase [Vicinamibacterales bacterium]
MLIRAPFQFRRERCDVPAGTEADYLVRVDVCGLCRSDLHAAASWAGDWQEVGHEFGGTVIAVRRPGARFAPGDRVAVRNASPCGECGSCRAGVPRRCTRLVVNMQGYRDIALCDERSLEDASGLDDDALALVEPTNVALDLLHAADIDPAHAVAVLGSGTLALLTAYVARHAWGATNAVVIGRQPESPLAGALGLPYQPAGANAAGQPRLRHADRVLVTTPPATLDQALALCRPGGWVVTVGLDDTERCTVPVDISRLIFGQITLKGVCAAPNAHFPQAIALLREHGPALRALIGRRVPRGDIETALAAWQTRPHYDGKTILLGGARCA